MTTAEIRDGIQVYKTFCKYAMLDCNAEDVLLGFTRLRQLRDDLARMERAGWEENAA